MESTFKYRPFLLIAAICSFAGALTTALLLFIPNPEATDFASRAASATPMGPSTILAATATGGAVRSRVAVTPGSASCSTTVTMWSGTTMIRGSVFQFVVSGIDPI